MIPIANVLCCWLLGALVFAKPSIAQSANGLPEDVELINAEDAGATGKLGQPFNNNGGIYQSATGYPVVLLDAQLQRPAFRAAAVLVGDSADAGPMGQVVFQQHPLGQPLLVTINATGMPPGKHAVHIHAFGDLKEGCKSTGPHLRHILIGNVEVKDDGKLEINFHSPYLSLFGPNKGIIGRSIVIHEKPIEYNRFPDIRGYPIVPTLNDQSIQAEEMQVGAIIACGIITITDN